MAVLLPVVLTATNSCTQSVRVERVYHSPYPPGYSVAVVPFLDHSGSESLDVMAVTDEFCAELQQVQVPDVGTTTTLHVFPVNRVLSELSKLGIKKTARAEDVKLLAESLDVDAVFVGSVTRYDPYHPPQMGMALQLYVRDGEPQLGRSLDNIDPGRLARSPTPKDLPAGPMVRPQAMVIRIFDASQTQVIERIKKYSSRRGADKTPSGWRKYTTSRNFLRFVCHEMIGELLAQEHRRLAGQLLKPNQAAP